jgi:putative transcriptional regulator
VLARVRVVEVLTHGWDLARATGQSGSFPDDVAERALAGTRRALTERPQGPGAPFAAEVAVPPTSPAVDRLAGFLGRPGVTRSRNQASHVTPPAPHSGQMTQAELAQRIGVTRQTIIAIEQGRYSPSLEVAFQIARVFKVPLDEVFQYPDGESR